MNEKIRKYVNNLFEQAPNTKRVNDLKDEIISNTTDKYNDYMTEGKTDEEAYHTAIETIGDVNELLEEIERNNPINSKANEAQRKKTALSVSVSIGLYVFGLISAIVAEELGLPEYICATTFLLFAGIATCILVYHFLSRPKYRKYEDSMVEDFKEWKNHDNSSHEVRKSINSIIWTLAVILYFLVSFSFMNWHISWLIFIIAGLVQNIVNLFFKLGER